MYTNISYFAYHISHNCDRVPDNFGSAEDTTHNRTVESRSTDSIVRDNQRFMAAGGTKQEGQSEELLASGNRFLSSQVENIFYLTPTLTPTFF